MTAVEIGTRAQLKASEVRQRDTLKWMSPPPQIINRTEQNRQDIRAGGGQTTWGRDSPRLDSRFCIIL
ncbi:hypothetical protein KOW79_022311 [Hemibagrus wyckioides]|uniref:Uncharacterized protein n=1 Tax=Hemibagrus wyckioides TaxID=337641 RepID=A0A9D3N3H5_9TELE|nr:hypothetical protein KOW79_022311 [Hemibagrus wyckioides]